MWTSALGGPDPELGWGQGEGTQLQERENPCPLEAMAMETTALLRDGYGTPGLNDSRKLEGMLWRTAKVVHCTKCWPREQARHREYLPHPPSSIMEPQEGRAYVCTVSFWVTSPCMAHRLCSDGVAECMNELNE